MSTGPSYREVLASVRASVETASAEVTVPMITRELGDALGIRTEPDTWSGYRSAAGDRLRGQVRRALEALTASGELVKTVREYYGRQKTACYAVPAVAEEIARRERAAAQEARMAAGVRVSRLDLRELLRTAEQGTDAWARCAAALERSTS